VECATRSPLLPCLIIGALLVLFLFDPSAQAWFPQCLFKKLTGWSCPACGGQRALHALLHGDFAVAAKLNPLLFVLGAPALLLGLLAWWRPALLRRVPRAAWWTLAGGALLLALVFGIVRNVFPELGWNA
jgi:hypothetical protein